MQVHGGLGLTVGHTIGQWRAKVAQLIRDPGRDVKADTDLDSIGLTQAWAQFSIDRPCELVSEVPGAGSQYLALPPGWVDGYSVLTEVEYPARQNPANIVDPKWWTIGRDPVTVTTQRIVLLADTPTASQWVRLTYTGLWPTPDATASTDLIDAVAFEAVAALAASFVEVALASEAARNRRASLPTDYVGSEDRARMLLESSKAHRQIYDSLAGLGGADDAGAAVSRGFDYDPQRGSLFHGLIR